MEYGSTDRWLEDAPSLQFSTTTNVSPIHFPDDVCVGSYERIECTHSLKKRGLVAVLRVTFLVIVVIFIN